MDRATNEQLKALAVETHSRQADEFASAYAVESPYRDCFNYSRRRLDELLEKHLPDATTPLALLDIGCGTGHHMMRYAARGYRVSGVDGSDEMLRHARANNPGADIRHADVESLPFADNTFDVAIAIEVMRYLPGPTKFIAEIHRVLKPGGFCIVTASPLLSLNGYPIVNTIASKLPLPGFVRLKQYFATSFGLRRWFRTAGFGRVEIHGVYFGPVNWIERLLPKATPKALQTWEPVDRAVADLPLLREVSNMFLVRAVK